MLKIFILFFLLIYIACELTKFNKLEGIKKKYSERVYNTPVVYIKIVALIITIVLTLINRCTKEGNLEKSGGIRGLLIMCLFFAVFLAASIRDIRKARKQAEEFAAADELLEREVDNIV